MACNLAVAMQPAVQQARAGSKPPEELMAQLRAHTCSPLVSRVLSQIRGTGGEASTYRCVLNLVVSACFKHSRERRAAPTSG